MFMLLSSYLVIFPVFTDCEDGDRVTDEEHAALDSAGIVFGQLTDVWPDAILYNESENSLWFIEAVTSDGEVDNHKFRQNFCRMHNNIRNLEEARLSTAIRKQPIC